MAMKQTRKNRLIVTHNLKKSGFNNVQACANHLMNQNEADFEQVLELVNDESDLLTEWIQEQKLDYFVNILDLDFDDMDAYIKKTFGEDFDAQLADIIREIGVDELLKKINHWRNCFEVNYDVK